MTTSNSINFFAEPPFKKNAMIRAEFEVDASRADEELASEIGQFFDDPVGFANFAFEWGEGDLEGQTGLDVWQEQFLSDVAASVRKNGFNGVDPVAAIREATASGHGIGKSALVAILILWIMSTRPYAKGIVTANTGDQLRTKTWGELAKWKSRCITGHWFEINSGKGSLSLYHKAFPETWRVDGQTCREENSEAFAGLHAANSTPFYIFDEASAVPDKIWEVAEGGLTDGEPMIFAFGNPTRNTGKFRSCFRSKLWRTRSIDSRTAKMTNKGTINDWLNEHGEDSDFFRVRVRGMFPKADDTQFIGTDVAEAASERGSGMYLGTDPLICGIDVARGGGDDSYIVFRRGKDAKSEKVYRIPAEKSRDSMKLVSLITMVLDKHKPDVAFLDETGIGGPILDRLVQLGYTYVYGVHFGGKADDEKHYSNKTAEMGARCRTWLMTGGSIPADQMLVDQLVTRMFWHNANDQLVLERKEEVKKRLGYSPDFADALYLTFAFHVPPLDKPRGMKDAFYEHRQQATSRSDYHPLDGLDRM